MKITKIALLIGISPLFLQPVFADDENPVIDPEVYEQMIAEKTGPKADYEPTLNGSVILDTRYRGRTNAEGKDMKGRLNYSSYNVMLNYNSGFINDFFSVNLGGYFSGDIYNNSIPVGDDPLCNEVGICSSGDVSKNAFDFKATNVSLKIKPTDNTVAEIGKIQGGVGTIGNIWTFAPGSYRGVKANHTFSEAFNLGYMWADESEAPWLQSWDDVSEPWFALKYSYMQTIGANGTVGALTYNLGIGQAKNVDYSQYGVENGAMFDTIDIESYNVYLKYALQDNLSLTYNMYGTDDEIMYNGFAAHHGAILDWGINDTWSVSSQIQYTQLDENAYIGEYAPRTMQRYGSNNGVYALWWDALSDWNMPGEIAWFNKASYKANENWTVNFGFAYGGNAKESTAGFSYKSEYAFTGDITYTVPAGTLKGTLFKLHGTVLERDAFAGKEDRDENDLRFIMIMPMSLI